LIAMKAGLHHEFDHFVLLMAGFLDFCGDFFAANCANDANGPQSIATLQ